LLYLLNIRISPVDGTQNGIYSLTLLQRLHLLLSENLESGGKINAEESKNLFNNLLFCLHFDFEIQNSKENKDLEKATILLNQIRPKIWKIFHSSLSIEDKRTEDKKSSSGDSETRNKMINLLSGNFL
jgi:hypothetical protein